MIKFKACPKCSGDLYLGGDIFGKYLSCLQCRHLRDVDAAGNEIAVELTAAEKKRLTA